MNVILTISTWYTQQNTHTPALEYELILLLSRCISNNTASSLLTISIVTPLPSPPRHLGLYVRRKWLQARRTTSASSALIRRLSRNSALTVLSTFSTSCLQGRIRSTWNIQSMWIHNSYLPESKNTASYSYYQHRRLSIRPLTCSNPPRSSIVSIALFIAMICNVWPVSCARSWTRLVLPTEAGPTRMTIQLICTHFITDSRDCNDWCRSDKGWRDRGVA